MVKIFIPFTFRLFATLTAVILKTVEQNVLTLPLLASEWNEISVPFYLFLACKCGCMFLQQLFSNKVFFG